MYGTKKFGPKNHGLKKFRSKKTELQNDFSTKKCPYNEFDEFFQNMMYEIEQMFVFFSIFFIWS